MDGHEIFNQVSADIDADIAKRAKAIMRQQVERVEELKGEVERKTAKLEEARKLLEEMVGMSGKEIVAKHRSHLNTVAFENEEVICLYTAPKLS